MIGWLLVLAAGGAGAYFYQTEYEPLVQQHAALQNTLAERQQALDEARGELEKVTGKVGNLEKGKAKLKGQLEAAGSQLRETEADLETVKTELAKSLQPDLDKGQIVILDSDGQYGVRVADEALFKSGTVGFHRSGKRVLDAIADVLLQLPNQRFQIQGHVDADPVITPVTRKAFATNWELSSAYATQVLLYLTRGKQVPEQQVSEAGFGDARPITKRPHGNGRVEIMLLGRRPLGSK